MLTVNVDRNKIGKSLKANVNVTADFFITAYEARATVQGMAYGRGIGFDLISDDVTASNGVAILSDGVKSFSFDIESTELDADGDYRISVYVRDENGNWNDCCGLFTNENEEVKDSAGMYILMKRNGTGTDDKYISAFSGNAINNFTGTVI